MRLKDNTKGHFKHDGNVDFHSLSLYCFVMADITVKHQPWSLLVDSRFLDDTAKTKKQLVVKGLVQERWYHIKNDLEDRSCSFINRLASFYSSDELVYARFVFL